MKLANPIIQHPDSAARWSSAAKTGMPVLLDVGCFLSNVRFSFLLLAALLAFPAASLAEDAGISVSGAATVKAKPTMIEITGVVTGEGEVANDASVKFRDNRKKALAAIDNLKNPDLTVEFEGSDVRDSMDPQQQMRLMQGQSTETPKMRTQITEHLKLKLTNADKLEPEKLLDMVLKLIDTSRDAGLSVGVPMTNYYQWQQQQQNGSSGDPLVQFKIPDTTELQNQACKLAIADARAKAQRIADMTGVKLGNVLAVHDYATTDTPPNSPLNGNEHAADKEAVSSTIGDIPITVRVQVQFEIAK